MLDTQQAALDRAPVKLADKALHYLRVIATYSGTAGRTPDELADLIGASPLAIRPRITELRKAGLIVDTGCRRLNRSGRKAVVWRAA